MRLAPPSFGKILVGTAVVIALSTGSAYAVGKVTSAQIKNETIKSVDIMNGQVQGVDIKDGTITSADIQNDSVTSNDIADGSLQSADVQNDSLTSSDLGVNSVAGSEVLDGSLTAADLAAGAVHGSELGVITQRSAVSANIVAGGNGSVTASCLAGERLISGGNDGFFDVFVVASRQSGNGWAVFGHNDSAANRTITAHAYCLQV